MSIIEKARESISQKRQHQEHIKKNMLSRDEENLQQNSSQETEEKARELIVQKRQHQEHINKNMLSRAEKEIKI